MMHIPVVFPDVQDSPLFRGKVRELETNVEALRERAAKLIKGAKKYKDGLEDAYQSTLAFANCLEVRSAAFLCAARLAARLSQSVLRTAAVPS